MQKVTKAARIAKTVWKIIMLIVSIKYPSAEERINKVINEIEEEFKSDN